MIPLVPMRDEPVGPNSLAFDLNTLPKDTLAIGFRIDPNAHEYLQAVVKAAMNILARDLAQMLGSQIVAMANHMMMLDPENPLSHGEKVAMPIHSTCAFEWSSEEADAKSWAISKRYDEAVTAAMRAEEQAHQPGHG